MSAEIEIYKPQHHIRVVTATSLFDGHDAAINIMRRILQDTGEKMFRALRCQVIRAVTWNFSNTCWIF